MDRLPDEFVAALLDEFEAKGRQHAYAKALLRGLEEDRRIVRADLMRVAEEAGIRSAAGQEKYACSHPRYRELRDALVKAIEDESLKHYECRLCEIKFEAWRSINANERQASR